MTLCTDMPGLKPPNFYSNPAFLIESRIEPGASASFRSMPHSLSSS
jgi:hypothetical protein